MGNHTAKVLVVALLVGVIVGAGSFILASDAPTETDDTLGDSVRSDDWNRTGPGLVDQEASIQQFESRAAFQSYVQKGQTLLGHSGFGIINPRGIRAVQNASVTVDAAGGNGNGDGNGNGASFSGDSASVEQADTSGDGPDRISETNVQESMLDEPDILKNDGQNVFYAPQHRSGGVGSDNGYDKTHVLSAATPKEPTELSTIDSNGKMLLAGDNLVVIERDQLLGYNVSDPANPAKQWEQSLNSSVVTARLLDGQFYLVTRERVTLSEPCPIEPLDGAASIDCTEVYRPANPTPVDATYSVLSIDPGSGTVDDTSSFVGTSDNTAVYMSKNALYVTYTEQANRGQMQIDFLLDTQSERLPEYVTQRLKEIRGYDISSRSMEEETERVMEQWFQSLPEDKRDIVRKNIRNDYVDYMKEHQRDLVRTGIVQVGVAGGDLSVDTVNSVPGRPLNQFSLDEHNGTLRITTTIPGTRGTDSRNDLYVLDSDSLEQIGSVQDMGVTERVYSVRYVGDTAYVVTFRRIDPFHVVDLSDPKNPEEVGKLKLPGFSSYLHPIDDNHVLGIGKEDGEVKAVLFNVSDPSNPTVQDDFYLNSGWSAISESHHAFLLDREHGVFFLPTGNGGSIIDYTDGKLLLEKQVDTNGAALRAMYVDDYMYVFGENGLTVIDERSWMEVETITFD